MASFIQVYDELKAIAHRQLANSIHQTINTTGLVHEAYVKLASVTVPRDREHLVGLVTNAMRQILLDAARARATDRRGNLMLTVSIENQDANMASADLDAVEVIAFDEALSQLKQQHARMGRVLELSFYGGVDSEEIAQLLGVTVRTVQRDLLAARTLVLSALQL